MKCKYCGHDKLHHLIKSVHIGEYCRACGKWQRWVPKAESCRLDDCSFPECNHVCGYDPDLDAMCPRCKTDLCNGTGVYDGKTYCHSCAEELAMLEVEVKDDDDDDDDDCPW